MFTRLCILIYFVSFFQFSMASSSCQLLHAKRIISFAPNLTEIIDAIGARESLVAVDKNSDYPEAIQSLAHLDASHAINIEKILSLKPDLILMWEQGVEPSAQAFLEKKGIRIYHAFFPDLESIPKVMEELGCLSDHVLEARAKAENFRKDLADLKKAYKNNPEATVFFQLWPKPLFALGGKGFLSEALKLCRGKNIFEEVDRAGFRVSTELVIRANPAYMLSFDDTMQGLLQWQVWSQLKAVKSHRLVYIRKTVLARPGPRILPGIRELCEVLR